VLFCRIWFNHKLHDCALPAVGPDIIVRDSVRMKLIMIKIGTWRSTVICGRCLAGIYIVSSHRHPPLRSKTISREQINGRATIDFIRVKLSSDQKMHLPQKAAFVCTSASVSASASARARAGACASSCTCAGTGCYRCMCVCMRKRVCGHVCAHVMHACLRACVHACARACVRACVCACVRACVHVCVRARACPQSVL
jgi:hypothetical protein